MDDLQAKRLENDIDYIATAQDKLESVAGGIIHGAHTSAVEAELEKRGYTEEVAKRAGAETFMLVTFSLSRLLSLGVKLDEILSVLGDVSSEADTRSEYGDVPAEAPDALTDPTERWRYVQGCRFMRNGYLEFVSAMLCQADPPPIEIVRRNAYDVCAFMFELYHKALGDRSPLPGG